MTKRPDADMANEVELQVGSDAMKQVAFDIGGALGDSGTWLYRLTGLARNSDNFVDGIHDDRYYFAPSLTWTPDSSGSRRGHTDAWPWSDVGADETALAGMQQPRVRRREPVQGTPRGCQGSMRQFIGITAILGGQHGPEVVRDEAA